MARDMHRIHVRGLVIAILGLIIAVAGLIAADRIESSSYKEPSVTVDPEFMSMPTLEYDGKVYRQKTNASITPILLLGYDKETDEQVGFRQGGSSDFMMLLVIDHNDKTIYRLLIDRDAMANVTVLGVTGRKTGTRMMQICLAHNFGATPVENNSYAMEATANLLEGVPIDFAVSMNMGNVSAFNRILGGVTVTIDEDLTAVDPAFIAGRTIALTDEQAYTFVHARKTVSDGSNVSRMGRHNEYMSGAIDRLYAKLKSSAGAANDLYNEMSGIIHTNLSKGRLINEMNRAAYYSLDDMAQLDGEHVINAKTNFMEFTPSEASIMDWVLRAYYRLDQ